MTGTPERKKKAKKINSCLTALSRDLFFFCFIFVKFSFTIASAIPAVPVTLATAYSQFTCSSRNAPREAICLRSHAQRTSMNSIHTKIILPEQIPKVVPKAHYQTRNSRVSCGASFDRRDLWATEFSDYDQNVVALLLMTEIAIAVHTQS